MRPAKNLKYTFKAKLWKYKGPAGWYFVTLPKTLSHTIRKNHGLSEEGWGRLKASATVKDQSWKTAIWFDTKAKSYLLPVKGVIRKAARLEEGAKVAVSLSLEEEDKRLSLLKAKK